MKGVFQLSLVMIHFRLTCYICSCSCYHSLIFHISHFLPSTQSSVLYVVALRSRHDFTIPWTVGWSLVEKERFYSTCRYIYWSWVGVCWMLSMLHTFASVIASNLPYLTYPHSFLSFLQLCVSLLDLYKTFQYGGLLDVLHIVSLPSLLILLIWWPGKTRYKCVILGLKVLFYLVILALVTSNYLLKAVWLCK